MHAFASRRGSTALRKFFRRRIRSAIRSTSDTTTPPPGLAFSRVMPETRGMASTKKGTLAAPPQWWKHLRPFWRRVFWKRERRLQQKAIRDERDER